MSLVLQTTVGILVDCAGAAETGGDVDAGAEAALAAAAAAVADRVLYRMDEEVDMMRCGSVVEDGIKG